MHTPTKQQWQTVIDNFVRVLPLAKRKRHLDMDEVVICAREHKCGTVHCVGGWYGVAVLKQMDKQYTSYIQGADVMAIDLGFIDHDELSEWADVHPEIWGNEWGNSMFSAKRAYDGAKNLHEVIAFLEKVKDRSPE